MRIALSLLTLALLVFGGHALASGDDDTAGQATSKDAQQLDRLKARLDALEMETAYLRSREAALTAYVLLNERRAFGLQALAAKARTEGFENKKIPAPSRVTLMAGLDGYARSLVTNLPKLTKQDAARLKKLTAFRRLKRIDSK